MNSIEKQKRSRRHFPVKTDGKKGKR